MGLDTNYLYIHDDNQPPLKSTTVSTQYEQITLSPSVVQMIGDYLYVRKKLVDDGAEVQTDMGQDIVLSIVCDAYNHEAMKESMKRKIQIVRVDQCDNG